MAGIEDLYKQVPTNMRTFAGFMAGDRSPITEANFKPAELAWLREAIRKKREENARREAMYRDLDAYSRKNAGKVSGGKRSKEGEWTDTYYSPEDYKDELASFANTQGKTAMSYDYDPTIMVGDDKERSLLESFNSPGYNVSTTLGSYTAEKLPTGEMVVTDTYDFDTPTEPTLENILRALPQIRNLRQAGNFAARVVHPNQSRPVRVNLGVDPESNAPQYARRDMGNTPMSNEDYVKLVELMLKGRKNGN